MLNDTVRNSEDLYFSFVIMRIHTFKYRSSKSGNNSSVFYSDDLIIFTEHFMQQLFIDRFYKPQIIMCGVYAFRS